MLAVNAPLPSPSARSTPPLAEPLAPGRRQLQFGGDDDDTYNEAMPQFALIAALVIVAAVADADTVPDCSVCASNCTVQQLEREAAAPDAAAARENPQQLHRWGHVEWLLKRFVQLEQLFVISLRSSI